MPSIFGSEYNQCIKSLNSARSKLHKHIEDIRKQSDKKPKIITLDLGSDDFDDDLLNFRNNLTESISELDEFYSQHRIIKFFTKTILFYFSPHSKAKRELKNIRIVVTKERKRDSIPDSIW